MLWNCIDQCVTEKIQWRRDFVQASRVIVAPLIDPPLKNFSSVISRIRLKFQVDCYWLSKIEWFLMGLLSLILCYWIFECFRNGVFLKHTCIWKKKTLSSSMVIELCLFLRQHSLCTRLTSFVAFRAVCTVYTSVPYTYVYLKSKKCELSIETEAAGQHIVIINQSREWLLNAIILAYWQDRIH